MILLVAMADGDAAGQDSSSRSVSQAMFRWRSDEGESSKERKRNNWLIRRNDEDLNGLLPQRSRHHKRRHSPESLTLWEAENSLGYWGRRGFTDSPINCGYMITCSPLFILQLFSERSLLWLIFFAFIRSLFCWFPLPWPFWREGIFRTHAETAMYLVRLFQLLFFFGPSFIYCRVWYFFTCILLITLLPSPPSSPPPR